MNSPLPEKIPSLDLDDFEKGTADQKRRFVTDLGHAFNTIGFVAIKNHGLSEQLRTRLYEAVQQFFALPEDAKQKYELPDLAGQRGYVGKGKETAKGFKLADLKEFYHIGQPAPTGNMPENVFPEELPQFRTYTLEVYKTFEHTGKILLNAIAIYLDLPEKYFEDKIAQGDSILRALHYFPIDTPNTVKEGAVRAAAHGDINLITLLMGASAEGLEVLRRDGQWIPITALPDQIVVNVGDMLDRLTNHRLKSTIHRVVNPPSDKMNLSRYSIPFFLHPRPDMDLSCLENCVTPEAPKLYSDMTAGQFLDERLRELGLKK